MIETKCEICEQLFQWEPQLCCSGFECGCMGQPVEPAICSEKCWDVLADVTMRDWRRQRTIEAQEPTFEGWAIEAIANQEPQP